MEAHDCHYGTPLHVACARQHWDCAKVLLNAGLECLPDQDTAFINIITSTFDPVLLTVGGNHCEFAKVLMPLQLMF